MVFSGFHQMVFNFLIAHNPHHFFFRAHNPQPFFYSHSPTKHTINFTKFIWINNKTNKPIIGTWGPTII